MTRNTFLGVILFAVMAGAFAENAKPLKAIAVVHGQYVHGNVTFTQNGCGEAVLVEVSIAGLDPGLHGFHVHEKGDLSNGCLSTGGHYNPDKHDHGAREDPVRHVGDLGNVNADEAGVALTKFSDPLITLAGPRSIVGRGIVIHEKADDLGRGGHPDSKKTGNAGGRVGCGVIGLLSPAEGDWPCTDAGSRTMTSLSVLLFSILSILYTQL